MSSKNVKFRKDSPPSSGSWTSSSSGHRRSDSGVGSLSDHDSSRAAYSDYAVAASDYEDQRFSVASLQEALYAAIQERDHWSATARKYEDDLAATREELKDASIAENAARKESKEVEARWHALLDRNEIIENEKKKLYSERKSLHEENASLRQDLERLEKKLKKYKQLHLQRVQQQQQQQKQQEEEEDEDEKDDDDDDDNDDDDEQEQRQQQQPPPPQQKQQPQPQSIDSPPLMSGAVPPEPPKIRRSASKRDKNAAEADHRAQKEKAQKEKARLSRRFDRNSDESDGNSNGNSNPGSGGSSGANPARPHRQRRTSYVEPLGPPAARPMVPPSPSRPYNYTPSQYTQHSQQYPPPSHPPPPPSRPDASVPRSIRPSVSYAYTEPTAPYYPSDQPFRR